MLVRSHGHRRELAMRNCRCGTARGIRFTTDGGDNVNWVQWRNEVFFWFVYDRFVDNGKILGQDKLEIPLVKNATFNARYRFRADPIYSIRKHFSNLYDDEEKENFIFPENGFRDLFLDLDFGQVGRGRPLAARWQPTDRVGRSLISIARLTSLIPCVLTRTKARARSSTSFARRSGR